MSIVNHIEVRDRIVALLRKQFSDRLDVETLQEDELLFSGDVGLASLNAIELVVSLEDEFGIFLEDDVLDLDNLGTVTKLTKTVTEVLSSI